MRLLNRLFGRTETRSLARDALQPQVGVFATGGYQDTGVAVTEMVAMTASAVYSCVAVISQAIASLPVHVLTRAGGSKQYTHPVARLLGGEPNEYQTAPDFRETMCMQLLLWGNAYAFIERDELGVPVALLP